MSSKLVTGLLAISSLWITSCHKQKISKSSPVTTQDSTVVVSKPAPTADSSGVVKTPEVVTMPAVSNADFRFLTAKSKFSFKNQTQDLDNVTVNLRIQKDSLIWISVTGVGFEIARGRISADTIAFLDKIHKSYFLFNYDQLSQKYNFKLDFKLLQSVIIGDLPFEQTPADSVSKQDEYYILKQKVGKILAENFVSEKTLKLMKLRAAEVPSNNTFSLDYDEFKPVSDVVLPFSSNLILEVKSPKDGQFYKTEVGIRHNKIEILNESPGFPFSIPSSYKQKM